MNGENTAGELFFASYVLFALAFISIVASCVLFAVFHIPTVINELSGRKYVRSVYLPESKSDETEAEIKNERKTFAMIDDIVIVGFDVDRETEAL